MLRPSKGPGSLVTLPPAALMGIRTLVHCTTASFICSCMMAMAQHIVRAINSEEHAAAPRDVGGHAGLIAAILLEC